MLWQTGIIFVLFLNHVNSLVKNDNLILTMEINKVATGLKNTEFVYKTIKIKENYIFAYKFQLTVDSSKVHRVNLFGCSTAVPGLVVYVFNFCHYF